MSDPSSQKPAESRRHAEADAAADLSELREAVLDDWLRVTSSVTDAVSEIENTLSWRVTRPLRLTRLLQRKVTEIGVIPASQLAAVAVAKRLGR